MGGHSHSSFMWKGYTGFPLLSVSTRVFYLPVPSVSPTDPTRSLPQGSSVVNSTLDFPLLFRWYTSRPSREVRLPCRLRFQGIQFRSHVPLITSGQTVLSTLPPPLTISYVSHFGLLLLETPSTIVWIENKLHTGFEFKWLQRRKITFVFRYEYIVTFIFKSKTKGLKRQRVWFYLEIEKV